MKIIEKIRITTSLLIFLTAVSLFSQYKREYPDDIRFMEKYSSKIGSGTLQEIFHKHSIDKKNRLLKGPDLIDVFIYFDSEPDNSEIHKLQLLGVECFTESWTPPIFPNHPLGFMLARVPANSFQDVLDKAFIRRVDTANRTSVPMNNTAASAVNASDLWAGGWTGSGVKIAILDSGLDTDPVNSDLPSSFEKMDYSQYPTLNSDVENHVTGHGTHVTGTVLGRGIYSSGNTGNGGGAFKGMAPDAELVFLKIANDTDGTASSTAIINALDAAVNIYNADIITMSYGGWNDYLDGSLPTEQKVDWCYSQGVPVFISAGNDANKNRHYSGTVGANSSTGYIQVDITTPADDSTFVKFNLVWSDGSARNDLSLQYFDGSYTPLSDVTFYHTTESTRGTESQKSNYNKWVKPDESTYYLKVVNNSSSSQAFHIFEDWGVNSRVTFANADPEYTISSPATADYAFAVGAWTTRSSWADYSGNSWGFGETLDDICSFSSRGPRIDGTQKPDITAPGSAIISLRDRDVYTSANSRWIDDDGTWNAGDAHYYIMQGTSMACPVVAGSAALLLDRDPCLTPAEIYSDLRSNTASDTYTGVVPNSTWGYGKLDVKAAMSGITVQLKVFLEGPYDSSTHKMKTSLRDADLIPLTSPYTEDPCTVSSVPAGIVDWVLIQLRTSADGSAAISKSVFVDPDGNIVDTDGYDRNIFFDVQEGSYYIVINHRNHIKIMSSSSVALYSDHTVLYDFTDSVSKAYGSNSIKLVEDNVYAMYAGDADGNGFITADDLNNEWRPNNGTYGYKNSDMNMDTYINAHDKNRCVKANNGIGTAVP